MFMESQILLITKPVAVKTAIVLGLSLSLINLNQPTLAQTTPPVPTPTQTSAVQTSSTSGDFFKPIQNVIKEVDQFIGDVRGFVQNDLFGTLNELLSSSLGAIKIPDLSQVSHEILNAPTSRYEGTQLSDQLENKLGSSDSQGSTAIMSELDSQAQRNAAIGIADGSTLSEEAQAQSRLVLQATEQDTTQNVQLAEESQNLDVSQHILQNLSQQTALNAQVNARVLQEAQQARTDRAINNVLLSQAAQEISAINTSDRRGSITSGNQASSQAGMLMLPGGGYLGQTTPDDNTD
jgi:hypothetical protein